MPIEFWAMGRPNAGGPNSQEFNAVRQAVRAEEIGYDGIVYVDSQNRYGDTYVAMALAAQATSTVKLGTGVTHSYTRHSAVTASAIAHGCRRRAEEGHSWASAEGTRPSPIWAARLTPFPSSRTTS